MSAKLVRIVAEIYPAAQGVVVNYFNIAPAQSTAPLAYNSEHAFKQAFQEAGIDLGNALPILTEERNGAVIAIHRYEAAVLPTQLDKLGYHKAGGRLHRG